MKKPLTIILGLCLGLGSTIGQAQSSDKYELFLESGNISPRTQRVAETQQLEAGSYKIIQFTALPNAQQKQALANKGIQLLGYVPNYAFYAVVNSDLELSAQEMADFSIRVIISVSPSFKLSPLLTQEKMPEWAVVEEGKVDLIVSVFENQSMASALEELRTYGVVQGEAIGQSVALRIPQEKLMELAGLSFVSYLEPIPQPDEAENDEGRGTHRGTAILTHYAGGDKYDGSGVTVAIGDTELQWEHIDFAGRLNYKSSDKGFSSDHGTHVGGTVAGAGNIDPTKQGQAPGVEIFSYTQSNGIYDIPNSYADGVRLTTQSMGSSCPSSTGLANYTSRGQTMDRQVRDYPSVMHFWSSGNDGYDDCQRYPSGWGNLSGGYKNAKNIMVVGRVDYRDQISGSSSRGPAYDGRIKPDIVGMGSSVSSTTFNNSYNTKSGTSMSTPGVSGVYAQLLQAYREHNGGSDPKGGLLKSIMLNTAKDLGNEGPDFIYGWGRVNALKALNCIKDQRYFIGSLSDGDQASHTVTVPAGVKRMRVMVYWSDYTPATGVSKHLVNDLDMTLSQGGTTHYPYVLNPSQTSSTALNTPATRGEDHLNNMEQVVIDNPSGSYTVNLNGYLIPESPQEYYVVYEFLTEDITVTYPVGGEGFVAGETQRIRWDAYGNSGDFKLEYTTDGGNSWNTITTSVSGYTRYYSWTVPSTVSGQAKVRVSRNGFSDESDANFALVGVPSNLDVDWVCDAQSVYQISWDAVSGADAYVVYQLGSKYMDSIGTTTDLNYQLPFGTGMKDLYAVASIKDGVIGRRAIAEERTGSGTYCSEVGQPMTVLLSQPTNGSSFTELDDVTVKADVTATSGETITKVEFYVNGVLAGSTTNSPYQGTLSGLTAGDYTIYVIAYETGGNNVKSNEVTIKVTEVMDYDVAVSNLNIVTPAQCGTTIDFDFDLENKGVQSLASYDLEVYLNNSLILSESRNESLATGSSTTVSFTDFQVSQNGDNDLKLVVKNPNGNTDENLADNEAMKSFVIGLGEAHQFVIASRSENSAMAFEILDNGTLVAEKSDATVSTSGANTVYDFCLVDGCYDLKVTDAFQAGGCNEPAWSASATYLGDSGSGGTGTGEVVSHNGKLWRALWWTNNEEPSVEPVWTEVGDCNVTYDTDSYQLLDKDAKLLASQEVANYASPQTDAFCTGSQTVVSADFSANNQAVYSCSDVTFTANTTGTITSYAWDFGADATPATATGIGPHVVSYSSTGAKTVSLTVNGNVVETKTNYVTVSQDPSRQPSLSVAYDATTICAGETVNASVSNVQFGGSNPQFEWKVNGQTVATNGNQTFAFSNLNDGDQLGVTLVTNETCVTSSTASTSSELVTVNPMVTPTISISADKTNICSGDLVSFASTSNGGTISWELNGQSVGNGSAYQSSSLNDGDKVVAVLTSNATCASATMATSNEETINVNPMVTPTISISADKTAICSGDLVSFTSTSNGGTISWELNGQSVGTGSTYQSSSLNDGDKIVAILTSDATCTSASTATSNEESISVTPLVTPAISIASNKSSICEGESMTFTATASSGTIDWKVNGQSTASGQAFQTSALVNGDIVQAVLTSDEVCSSSPTASSNEEQVLASKPLDPSVSVEIENGEAFPVCANTTLSFKADPVDEGTNPNFYWKVDNVVVGQGDSYSTATLKDGQEIVCEMVVSESCVVSSKVASTPVMAEVLDANNSQCITFTENALFQNVVLYPNPTADVLNIEGLEEGTQLSLLTSQGVMIQEGLGYEVQMQALPAGTYFLKIEKGEKVVFKSIVKQ